MTTGRHEATVEPTEGGFLFRAVCPDCPWRSDEHSETWCAELAEEHHQERGVRRDVARPNPSGWKRGLITDGFTQVAIFPDGTVAIYATITDGVPKQAQGRPVGLNLTRADALALAEKLGLALLADRNAKPIYWNGPVASFDYERETPVEASEARRAAAIDVSSSVGP